jgi:hypothetical protein
MEDLEACLGVEGNLAKKLTQWKKEDQAEREEEERRRINRGGQKILWMLMTRRTIIFRNRARMMKMILKRSKIRQASFLLELGNSFDSVSGSSKTFEKSPSIS